MTAAALLRHVPQLTTPVDRLTDLLIEGESTSDAANQGTLGADWPAEFPGVSIQRSGLNGQTLLGMVHELQSVPKFPTGDGLSVAVVWSGINSLSSGYSNVSAAQALALFSQIVDLLRFAGWDRVLMVPIPAFNQRDESATGADADYYRTARPPLITDPIRSAIHAGYAAAGFDALADLSGLVWFDDSTSLDDKRWRSDRVHFTSAANDLISAAVAAAARRVAAPAVTTPRTRGWESTATGRYDPAGEYLHKAQGLSPYIDPMIPDFWVDGLNGSDDQPGSENRPWRTIAHASRMVEGLGARVGVEGPQAQTSLHGVGSGTPENFNWFYALPGKSVSIIGDLALPGVWLKRVRYVGTSGFTIRQTRNDASKLDWLMGVHNDGYDADGLTHHLIHTGHKLANWGQPGGGQGARNVMFDGCEAEDGAHWHSGGGSNFSLTRGGTPPQNGDDSPIYTLEIDGVARPFHIVFLRCRSVRARQKVVSFGIGLNLASDGQYFISGDILRNRPWTGLLVAGCEGREFAGGQGVNSFEGGNLSVFLHNDIENAGRHNEFAQTPGDPLFGTPLQAKASYLAHHYPNSTHGGPANPHAIIRNNVSVLGGYPQTDHVGLWGSITGDVQGNSWQGDPVAPVLYAPTDLYGRELATSSARQGV